MVAPLLGLVLMLGRREVSAQDPSIQPPAPAIEASVRGRAVRPGVDRQNPVPNLMVTLHRVAQDSAGPLDSMLTSRDGAYAFRYRRAGDDAIYFASATYSGITYFSSPLGAGAAGPEQGEITVFDTTSGPVRLTVQGHHVVVSRPAADGTREIVEVFEVSNDSMVTKVGADSLTSVWSAPVPSGATHFRGRDGDVAASSLVLRDGRAQVLAAFGPGVKQLSYSYTLAAAAFPLAVPAERATSVLEVLVEEETARVSGAGVRAMEAARAQGRLFRRYLAQDVPAGDTVRVEVQATTAETRSRWMLAVGTLLLAAMGAGLVRALRARRGRAAAAPDSTPAEPTRDQLLGALAALDARQERADAALPPAEYAEQRAALKATLQRRLAGERTPA